MSEGATWTGKLAVTGVGLVTPVGLSAPASLAALRAGVSRIGDLQCFQVPNAQGELAPATGAEVPIVPGRRQGPARLARLAGHALREAVTEARLPRNYRRACFIGTSAPHPGKRILPNRPALERELAAAMSGMIGGSSIHLCETGRASALEALRVAATELTRDKSELQAAIVGGVDSLVNPLTMQFLQSMGRLREGRKSTGVLPGEGAGFLVIERTEDATKRGIPVLALLKAAAGGTDPTPPDKPNTALVLGRVLRAVATSISDPAPLIISDLNGERQRAYEWMFASTRAPFYHGGMPHWLPSESLGDAGAASGAITSVWAIGALRKGYARRNEAVVWGGSDEGSREALVIQRTNGS